MNSDATFQIGKDHTVCEDYALSGAIGQPNFAYAVVCDGCSASPEVDFGAQVVARSAECAANSAAVAQKFPSANEIGELITLRARKIWEVFPALHPQALDATCLMAMVKDGELYAYLFGDGVIIHRSEGRIIAHHVALSSGAPDYLSYSLDKRRRAAYDLLPDNIKEIEHWWNGELHQTGKFTQKPFEPLAITGVVLPGDTISVISDGINSFRKSDNTPIPWQDLVEDFTGFKNFEGQFVQRRISAFKRKCLKEGWHHLDDISIATVVV